MMRWRQAIWEGTWWQRTRQRWKLALFLALVVPLIIPAFGRHVGPEKIGALLALAVLLAWYFWAPRCYRCGTRVMWFLFRNGGWHNAWRLQQCPACGDAARETDGATQ